MSMPLIFAVLAAVAFSQGNAASLRSTTTESLTASSSSSPTAIVSIVKVAGPDPQNENALTLQEMYTEFPKTDMAQYLSKDAKAECGEEFLRVCKNALWPCPCKDGTLKYDAMVKMFDNIHTFLEVKFFKTEMYVIDSKTIVTRFKFSAQYKGKRIPFQRLIEIITFDDQGKIAKVKALLHYTKGGPASKNVETMKQVNKAIHGEVSKNVSKNGETMTGGEDLTTIMANEMAKDVLLECGEAVQKFCEDKVWCPCKDGSSLGLAAVQKKLRNMQLQLRFRLFKYEFYVVDAKTLLIRLKTWASFKPPSLRFPTVHMLRFVTFNGEGEISKLQPYPEFGARAD